ESPALKIMQILGERGAEWEFHDPHVAALPRTRSHPELNGRAGVPLDAETLGRCQAVLICTDHDAVDYALVARHAAIVVDTRNALASRGLAPRPTVVSA
ncbi:MAG: nucleotide sugar dehydrogenase, partial [Rhodospirillaceae bacterium]|nr:nucleotide sugar dehydrogenase [Rhodospirillaceae bacterium]